MPGLWQKVKCMVAKYCPNCGVAAEELKDNRILCVPCNAVYKVEADGTARVIDSDPLNKIHKRIDALELKVTPQLPAEPDEPERDTGLELEPKFLN